MDFLTVILVAALVFGVCFLIDKGFTKLFRSQAQHMSGKAVRLNKKYGAVGLIMVALGVAAVFTGLEGTWIMIAGGGLIITVGVGLVVYYMTYGIFYDEDTFLYTSFGKKTRQYSYKHILAQQLYNNAGHILVELHMADGQVVQLQLSMNGAVTFLDHAWLAWLRQTGRQAEHCDFHDPDNSCWFPPVSEQPTVEV